MADVHSRKEILAAELERVEGELERPGHLQEACEILIRDLRSQGHLTEWKRRNVKHQIKRLDEIVQHCRTLKSAQQGQ